MKIFLRVLGFVFLALALIMLATEIDDARGGKSENRAVGIAMMIIFGGSGLMMLRAASNKQPPRPRPMDPPPPVKPSAEKKPDDDFV